MEELSAFDRTIDQIGKEFTGKIVAFPGYRPIGKVIRVNENGAHLENGGRISVYGLLFYHPVRDYQEKK